jgi:hypothetical protein
VYSSVACESQLGNRGLRSFVEVVAVKSESGEFVQGLEGCTPSVAYAESITSSTEGLRVLQGVFGKIEFPGLVNLIQGLEVYSSVAL